jgi:hypothetical protein
MLAVAAELLLLGIDRENGLAAALKVLPPGVKILAWRVAVRVRPPLTGLACSLYAVVRRLEQLAHQLGADLVPLGFELGCELADTLTRPAQGGVRVASGRGLDQGFQIVQQRRVVQDALLAPAPRPSHPLVAAPRRRHSAGVDLLNASVERRA